MPTKTKAKPKSGMLSKLQGFRLVAVAGPSVGLYLKGNDGWAIYIDGEFSTTFEGLLLTPYGYPKAPDRNWRWLFAWEGNTLSNKRTAKRQNGRVVSLDAAADL